MNKKKHIGLFFGSFNPIHVGHLIIASHMVDYTDMDELWFVISPHNPLKKKASLLEDHHRLALVRIAVEDDPRLKASNAEFSLPQPSYTIHTLTHLKEQYPDYRFSLIMGEDNLQSFHKWKNYEQILEENNIFVYPRPDYNGEALKDHPHVHFVDAPVMELSASLIRQGIKEKRNVRYMLSSEVYTYIEEMNFYR